MENVKQKALHLYKDAWFSDANLRLCSIEARGLWLEMLLLMLEGQPYGYLTTNSGKPMTIAELAKITGIEKRKCNRLVAELQQFGVYSVAEPYCIFARKMVRMQEVRVMRKEIGKLGGNPQLKQPILVNLKDNLTTPDLVNQEVIPNSNSNTNKVLLSSNVNKPSVVSIATGNESDTYKTAVALCEKVNINFAIPYQFFKKYESEYEKKDLMEAIKATASYQLSKGNTSIHYATLQRFLRDYPMKQYDPREDSPAAEAARKRALDPEEAKKKKAEWARIRELNAKSITKQT